MNLHLIINHSLKDYFLSLFILGREFLSKLRKALMEPSFLQEFILC